MQRNKQYSSWHSKILVLRTEGRGNNFEIIKDKNIITITIWKIVLHYQNFIQFGSLVILKQNNLKQQIVY